MLTAKSNTRLTLALDIIQKLGEGPFGGYHELGIIKHAIDLYDTLTIEESESMRIVCNNPAVPLDDRNVCWKAAELLKKQFSISDNVTIGIIKNIPVMGGLAGGSTDAATTLKLLNELWRLNLTQEKLIELGRQLGMDVPYYFLGGTAYDTEATGVLRPIATDLKLAFVLALPEFGVSTKEAYQNIDYSLIGKERKKTDALVQALQKDDFRAIAQNCHNDFELSVFKTNPVLAAIKEALLKAGCDTAFMSGSGSTMVGMGGDKKTARKIAGNLPYHTLVCESL